MYTFDSPGNNSLVSWGRTAGVAANVCLHLCLFLGQYFVAGSKHSILASYYSSATKLEHSSTISLDTLFSHKEVCFSCTFVVLRHYNDLCVLLRLKWQKCNYSCLIHWHNSYHLTYVDAQQAQRCNDTANCPNWLHQNLDCTCNSHLTACGKKAVALTEQKSCTIQMRQTPNAQDPIFKVTDI